MYTWEIEELLLLKNYLLTGKEYLEMIDTDKIINLGYINWISDCYAISDLAVLTDDGNMIQESILCELPIISLTHVKYGRYHNMASIYKGIVLETSVDTANDTIISALENIDEIRSKIPPYKEEILNTNDKIVDEILE